MSEKIVYAVIGVITGFIAGAATGLIMGLGNPFDITSTLLIVSSSGGLLGGLLGGSFMEQEHMGALLYATIFSVIALVLYLYLW